MKALSFEEIKLLKKQQKHHAFEISILCDRLTNPENIAHVFRLGDALSISEVILLDESPSYNMQKIHRLSRNGSKSIDYRLIDSMEEYQHPNLYALEWCDLSQSVFEYKGMERNFALAIGSERHGLSSEVLEKCKGAIHVPMYGINSSMNVAMAAGIALYTVIGRD